MSDRRRHSRTDVFFPVRIDSPQKSDRIGVARNSSASGLLIGTPSHFAVGDPLVLTFGTTYGEPERRMKGRVVRVDLDEEADLFYRLVAVALDVGNAA